MEELIKLDPKNKLDPNNTQRILRAYEVVSFTDKPLSYWWNQGNNSKYDNIKTIVLLPPKKKLWENILKRAIQMIDTGAIDEVQEFLSRYSKYEGPLYRVIGFVEIQDFLNQKISKEKLIKQMFIRTRQYAKRQLTWFRHKLKANFDINKCYHTDKNLIKNIIFNVKMLFIIKAILSLI